MTELTDAMIEHGVRKRAKYDNAQRARLALNVERVDGGTLQIIVETDMRSHDEAPDIQQNTFLSVLPLARLPGYERHDVEPRGALPRPGYIYVFHNGTLWRELACDGRGNLAEVDVAHWRKQLSEEPSADDRPSVGKPLPLILVPMLLQGRFVGDQYSMAYSEIAWTREYIAWLEADRSRVTDRCQNLGPAWAAAVVGPDNWRPTQSMPVVLIERQKRGLRARDFAVETSLADPADFTPGFIAFSETEWILKLQRAQEQLANSQGGEQPLPLPPLEADSDVLADRKLYGYPRLVGVLLHDPLFALRHATAQVRLQEAYLLSLNALITSHPHGKYAQLVYSTVMRTGHNPLRKFSGLLDQPSLLKAVSEAERSEARVHLESMLRSLADLFEHKVRPVAQDYLFARDERLLEPYAWVIETLDALNKLPSLCDAICLEQRDVSLESRINRLVNAVLSRQHPLSKLLLANEKGELPEAARRLETLRSANREPDPAHMGLSTLLQAAMNTPSADTLSLTKNVTTMVGDFMDSFAMAVGTQINRISGSLVNVELSRLFAPTFGIMEKLSPSWSGLKLMNQSDAVAQGLVILGVQGGGLRFGLTAEERRTLTHKNYRYATLHDQAGNPIGSTSPRHADRQFSNLGRITIIAAPADHPQVRKLSAWKIEANRNIRAAAESPALPSVALTCALINLRVQLFQMKALKQEKGDGEQRYRAGVVSALSDLTVALSTLTKPVLGNDNQLSKVLSRPRLDVSRVSTGWAQRLQAQTGSSKLPILRLISGWAMFASTGLAIWDAKRSWHQGDRDASLAYGVAATGGAAWTAYALGMSINPIVLVAGGILFVGGSVTANWLIDTDIEAVIKNGPFGFRHRETGIIDTLLGNDERFVHLSDPHAAYLQLIGTLGRPIIGVQRLKQWREQSSPSYRAALKRAQAGLHKSARTSLNPSASSGTDEQDWVVTVESPLLSMFQNGRDFQLFAEEQFTVLPLYGPFQTRRVERRSIDKPKLSTVQLDDATVLYLLPHQYPTGRLSPLQRSRLEVTHRIKIWSQFHLELDAQGSQTLVLPQPSPKTWRAYNASFRSRPHPGTDSDESMYWDIQVKEFKA